MKNQWDADDLAALDGPLAACVYCTRLIGSDPSLVLHGGGNSSIKAPYPDITGETIDALWVKGSGWDMGSIEAAGFAPLPIARLHQLLELDTLSDPDMARELRAAKLDPNAPDPSVETLLHAHLPHRCIQHSHADAIITLTNTNRGEQNVRDVFGSDVVIVPYVKPGFDLARLVSEIWPQESTDTTIGMVLLNHGLFTFGDTDRSAYERHVELISRAETWLDHHAPRTTTIPEQRLTQLDSEAIDTVIALRHDVSKAAGAPMLLQRHTDAAVTRFVARPDLADIATSGPLTPDHVIRTKRTPLIGTDVNSFTSAYHRYFEQHNATSDEELVELDPAPRVVLAADLGMLTAGRTWKEASIAADVYHRTIGVIERATDHLGGYQALPPSAIFGVEYWDLEQAKLRRQPAPLELAGQIAIVTGAASGIGKACAIALAKRGAVVVGVDVSPTIEDFDVGPGSLGIQADLTDPAAHRRIVTATVDHAGGTDIAVLAAGILGDSNPIAEYDPAEWERVQRINLQSATASLSALHPLLVASPAGGRVVAIASKNVPAPGPGAGSYSTSKAGLTQLVRIAALEWAGAGIRVNAVHPDAVFDTGLWTDDTIRARADRYGLTVEEYKRRNLLGIDITSHDVAATVVALCTDTFRATTGCAIPIDGGNERVI